MPLDPKKITVHLRSIPFAVYRGQKLSLEQQLERTRVRIQESYPAFVEEVGRKWRLEEEPLWPHLPFTELSTLRSPLIVELWHRLAAAELARELKVEKIEWRSRSPDRLSPLRQRFKWLLRTTYWHLKGRRRSLPQVERPTFLCTFAPNFFEGERDLLFGELYQQLEERGKEPVYLANLRGGWGDHRLPDRELVVVEGLVSPLQILSLALDPRSEWSLLRKVRAAKVPLFFLGLQATELVRQELMRDLLRQENLDTRLLQLAVQRVKAAYPRTRVFCFGFENQPRERAILAAKGTTPAVGFEPSLFTRSHLPWWAGRPEWRQLEALIVYGPYARRHFAPKLGHQKLIQPGPVRYARLLEQKPLHEPRNQILLATPIDLEMARKLLEVTLEVGKSFPELRLAVRFHPHQKLPETGGLRIVRERLYEEMQRSLAVVFCSSRIGVEALAMGAVPVVYAPVGQWEVHSLTDFPQAAVWCRTPAELSRVLTDLLERPERFDSVRKHGVEVLNQLMYPRDRQVAERAVSALEERGLL